MLSQEENTERESGKVNPGAPAWQRPWLAIRILIALAVLAGLIYGYLLFFKEPHMRNQPMIKTFQASLPALPEGIVRVDPPPALSAMPDSTKNPLRPLQANLDRGKEYYGYYCAFCHGKNGGGNGPVGESYVPAPGDLRKPGIGSYSDNRLYRAMLTGAGHEPVLERVIPPEHRWYLVLYVRSLNGRGKP
jgi:mono/diheme cytochrome c family protein